MAAGLPSRLLALPVDGFNVPTGSTLGSLLGEEPTLLVFLRHHG